MSKTNGMMRFKIMVEADVLFELTDEMNMTVVEVQANADAAGEINLAEPRALNEEDQKRLKAAGLDAALRYVSFRATEKVKAVGSMVEHAHIMSVATPDKDKLN